VIAGSKAAATEYAYSQRVFVPEFSDTAINCNIISIGKEQTTAGRVNFE
jgi:hypothetical protein